MTAIISISASIFSFFESLQGMDLMSVCKQLARQFYNNNVLKVSIHVFPSQCLRRPPAHPPTPPRPTGLVRLVWAGLVFIAPENDHFNYSQVHTDDFFESGTGNVQTSWQVYARR